VRLGVNRAVGAVDGYVVSATMVCPGVFFDAAVRGIGGR
jgi:hypothetical protein